MLIVDSGYYVAGLIFEGDTCIEAAPIVKWAVGKNKDYLLRYFLNKKFKVEEIHETL